MTTDISTLVAGIQQRIKDAPKGGVVSFEFTPETPFVISNLIQKMLADKGYVAIVSYAGGNAKDPTRETLYIDLSRRRPKVPKGPAQAGPGSNPGS